MKREKLGVKEKRMKSREKDGEGVGKEEKYVCRESKGKRLRLLARI